MCAKRSDKRRLGVCGAWSVFGVKPSGESGWLQLVFNADDVSSSQPTIVEVQCLGFSPIGPQTNEEKHAVHQQYSEITDHH